jgi:hypothetical protein
LNLTELHADCSVTWLVMLSDALLSISWSAAWIFSYRQVFWDPSPCSLVRTYL